MDAPVSKTKPFFESSAAQFENVRAWLFLVVLSFAGRLIWLFGNWDAIGDDVPAVEWAQFVAMGFRYDAKTITYLMLPCMLAAMAIALFPRLRPRVAAFRNFCVILLAALIPGLAFANSIFFKFNNTVFNAYIFEFFNGNAEDTIVCAIRDFGAAWKIPLGLIISGLAIFSWRRWFSGPITLPAWIQSALTTGRGRLITTMCFLLVFGLCLRGRAGTRPLQRIDCGATSDRVLNLGSLHPIYNLRTAWKGHAAQADFFGKHRLVPDAALAEYTALIAGRTSSTFVKAADLDPALLDDVNHPLWKRMAGGPPAAKPDHVFVLFMESYDSWPFLEEYRELQIVEEGRRLGDAGHRLMNYLPGDNGSLLSSLVFLQGMFDTNRSRQQQLPTSLPDAFQRLGYRTRSINAFSSEWSGTHRIAHEQGFEEIYCVADIKPEGDTQNLQVHDRTLFNFAAEKLDYDEPTFSFIRACSYHGPFEVDLKAENCEIDSMPESIMSKTGVRDEAQLCEAYGTLRYSDRMVGEFVDRMSEKYPNSLFVITGDHYGRHFVTTVPPLYEGASVPLIMYGPEVLKGTSIPEDMAASHVDLATTLIELCAPQGFEYISLGKNILEAVDNPMGVGRDFVVFPDVIVSFQGVPSCARLPWKDGPKLSKEQQTQYIEEALKLHDAYHGIGYMMARKALESN